MQQKPFTPQSHFDSIFNFVCPAGMEKQNEQIEAGTVVVLIYECTTDFIRVDLDIETKYGDDDTQTIYVNHDKFRDWLLNNGYLTISVGGDKERGGNIVNDEADFEIGYAEFLDKYLNDNIMAEYLEGAKIVNHTFQI